MRPGTEAYQIFSPLVSDNLAGRIKDVRGGSVVPPLEVLVNDAPGGAGGPLRITTVTAASAGGAVLVSDDGLRLLYAPLPGFAGTETFRYSVVNGAGLAAEAEVVVSVEPAFFPNTPPTFTLSTDLVVLLQDGQPFSRDGFVTGINPSEPGQAITFLLTADRPRPSASCPPSIPPGGSCSSSTSPRRASSA